MVERMASALEGEQEERSGLSLRACSLGALGRKGMGDAFAKPHPR